MRCQRESQWKECELLISHHCPGVWDVLWAWHLWEAGALTPCPPCLLGCPTPGRDLAKVGLWLRHHLPAFQIPSKMPSLGVELLLSWAASFIQDRESIHATVGGRFFIFEDKRELTAGRRKACRVSLQQQLVQLPASPGCLGPKSSSGLRSCLLLWRCYSQHRKLMAEVHKKQNSVNPRHIYFL